MVSIALCNSLVGLRTPKKKEELTNETCNAVAILEIGFFGSVFVHGVAKRTFHVGVVSPGLT